MTEQSAADELAHAAPAGYIDAWINPNLAPPDDTRMNVGYLFPDLMERWKRGTTLPQLIDEMDESGVEKGVLCSGYGAIDDRTWVTDAVTKYPDRFVASHVIDPHKGLESVRLVESLVKNDGYKMIRMLGYETQIPYNHPRYYPVYTKCAELDIPVGLNVGIPGPFVPGRYQDPLPIDDVCAYFPELKIVMQHGGEPWVDLCVKLMIKWSNLYYMTSAFAPKHIPKPILHYLNTRGADRIMWATDYPLLTFARCVKDIEDLEFKDEERKRKFVAENVRKLLFS
jgi:predicted TIM-barrel fold metal-dependent hydrolase